MADETGAFTGRALFKKAAAEEFIALYKKASILSQFPGQFLKSKLAGDAAARTAMKLLIRLDYDK